MASSTCQLDTLSTPPPTVHTGPSVPLQSIGTEEVRTGPSTKHKLSLLGVCCTGARLYHIAPQIPSSAQHTSIQTRAHTRTHTYAPTYARTHTHAHTPARTHTHTHRLGAEFDRQHRTGRSTFVPSDLQESCSCCYHMLPYALSSSFQSDASPQSGHQKQRLSAASRGRDMSIVISRSHLVT